MAKTMPISEVKTRLPELVSGVEEREDEIVVTRNGKPAAVLINYDEYERLKETLDVLSDPVSMRQIAQSKRFYAKQQQGESFEPPFRRTSHFGKTAQTIMAGYRPDIPPPIAELIRHLPPEPKRDIKQALRSLSSDPFCGTPLIGELRRLWRIKVRRFRSVYAPDRNARLVRTFAIAHRRELYEKAAELVRRDRK